MSEFKPNKRPASEFSSITTLRGMSGQDQADFSWSYMKRYFKVALYDKSKICVWCKTPFTSLEEVTLDHIVPRSEGGRTRLINLQLMHSKCNSKKGRVMPKSINSLAFKPTKSHTDTITKYMKKRESL